jgi:phospholipid/cholesterol/gamma-HCH transport system substrate-binding protein
MIRMKLSKEFKIGLVAIVGLVVLYAGINYLKGIVVFSNQRVYYAVYPRVDGLQKSNPVIINGYVVGQVKKVTLLTDTLHSLLVEILISEDNLDIPSDSWARISSGGLLGTKEIELILGTSTQLAVPGDTLKNSIEVGLMESVNKEILPLKMKTEELISDIDSIITIFQVVLNENTRKNLEDSFTSIRLAIQSLEKTAFRLDTLVMEEKHKLGLILDNVASITHNLEHNNNEITNIIHNFSSISDSLAQSNFKEAIFNASEAMNDVSAITTKINNGEGSLGLLINNDSLYNNLTNASDQLDRLLEDFRLHPDRYVHVSVFGGKKEKGVKLTKSEIEDLKKVLREE